MDNQKPESAARDCDGHWGPGSLREWAECPICNPPDDLSTRPESARRLPDLDRGALTTADLAYINTDGAPSTRVEAAIRAYVWSLQVADETGLYPSLNDLRDVLTRPETTTEETGRD